MNLFENLAIDEEKLHNKYLTIRNNLAITGEQSILSDWISGFEDRDNKIVKEFQTTFHSAFWEFYLYALFKEAEFQVDFSKNRPDFIIKNPSKIYIEAVVANIKQGGAQEEKRQFSDILSMIKPHSWQSDFDESMRESIVRYSNSISLKSKKYSEYSMDEGFEKSTPYLIALSGYEQINYGNNFHYAMLALLYGCYYDNINEEYNKVRSILKPGTDSPIPVGIFLDDKMAHVSAVIFSCTLTLGKLTSLAISQNKSPIKLNSVMSIRHDCDFPHFKVQIVSTENPEYLSDGVFIFHNPFAENPLSKKLFEKTNAINVELDIDSGTLLMDGNNLPIVSRLNLALGGGFIAQSIEEVIKAFNPDLVVCQAKVQCIEKSEDDEGYDVKFKDIKDNIDFALIFSEEMLEKHKPKNNDMYRILFKLPKNNKIPNPTADAYEVYQNFSKIRCLLLNDGCLADIQKIEEYSFTGMGQTDFSE
ncbi:hypothetical protein K5M33_16300 [Chromobacterium vaccinii]|nr:hypothetical protein [Chromobacterium vaccinii]MBX9358283.1 hypothetical protein [Chromobacterium vaccinii]